MNCRVKIDAPHGIVEIEGNAEFVSAFYEKLSALMDRAHFGIAVSAGGDEARASGEQVDASAQDATTAESAGKPKAKRKKRPPPPAGSSCRDRILVLKQDGFFKDRRTVQDIVTGLAKKGWTHNNSQAGAALTHMFNRGEVQRTNEGSGFEYFWDRD